MKYTVSRYSALPSASFHNANFASLREVWASNSALTRTVISPAVQRSRVRQEFTVVNAPESTPASSSVLIVITHSHGDHYSPEDIERVRKEDTCFATTAEVARLLERDFGIDDDYISELSFEAPRIGFECGAVLEPVAAENKNHPVSFGFGLVLEFAGFTYYLSGDTDVLVDNVQCDVLFVVCDGIWNMPDYEKSVPAQVAAMDVLPGLVVPYHYGVDAPSTKENGARLCAALTAAGIPCREWKKGLF